MSRKEFVTLIVSLLSAISAVLTTLYLQGCSGMQIECKGEYCISKK